MGTTVTYAVAVLVLSMVTTAAAFAYIWRTQATLRLHHDDRAAREVSKAVGLLVTSIGMTVSAYGLLIGEPVLATFGLSLSRGALFVLVVTLVIVHPGDNDG